MKKFKLTVLSIGLAVSFLFPVFTFAETRYVSDQLEVTLRTGPSLSHAIVRMLKSGVALEVLEDDVENGHTRVKTSGGAEGWILTRYLMREPTARMQLEKLTQQIARVDNPNGSILAQLTAISNEYEKAMQQINQLESEKKQLEKQLASIKHTAANAISIGEENQLMHQKVDMLEDRVVSLQIANRDLESEHNKNWFFAGAWVLVGGLLLGLILPRLFHKKVSRYESF